MFLLVVLLLAAIFGVGLYLIVTKFKNRSVLKYLLFFSWLVALVFLWMALYIVYWVNVVSDSGLVPF